MFYDRLGVFGLNEFILHRRVGPIPPPDQIRSHLEFLDDVQKLADLGLVFDFDPTAGLAISKVPTPQKQILSESIAAAEEWLNRQWEKILQDGPRELDTYQHYLKLAEHISAEDTLHDLRIRLWCCAHNSELQSKYFAASPFRDEMGVTPYSEPTDTLSIVIQGFPVVQETTPWDQLLEFRADSKTRSYLNLFRYWFRKFSTDTKPADLVEEISQLLHEYITHMERHRIACRLSTLEAVVKLPVEILENILRLRLSTAVEALFAVRRQRLALLDAERNIPGHELQYLIKARAALVSEK